MDIAVRLTWPKDERGYELVDVPPYKHRTISGSHEGGLSVAGRGGEQIRYVLTGTERGVAAKIANTPCTPEGVLNLTNDWGYLTEPGHAYFIEEVYGWILALESAFQLAVKGDLISLERRFPEKNIAALKLSFERYGKEATPRLYLKPANLINFAWIELMLMTSSNIGFRHCANCGNVFTFGLEKGSRSTRQYCSGRCRVAGHRAKKKATCT